MKGRAVLALVPLVGGLALWLGAGVPALRERDRARAEYARVRAERERLRAQAGALERRGARRTPPTEGTAAARALRASLLEAAAGLPVGSVQLAVSPGRGRVAASGRLGAVGRTTDVLRLAERLAASGPAMVVDRLDLAAAANEAAGVRLDVDVHSERPGP